MNKRSIHSAANAVRTKMAGKHFTNQECLDAIEVLHYLHIFGAAAHLPMLAFWAGNQLSSFEDAARNRGLDIPELK